MNRKLKATWDGLDIALAVFLIALIVYGVWQWLT